MAAMVGSWSAESGVGRGRDASPGARLANLSATPARSAAYLHPSRSSANVLLNPLEVLSSTDRLSTLFGLALDDPLCDYLELMSACVLFSGPQGTT